MHPKINLILADNQALFRESLRVFLKTNNRFEVVEEVANGKMALEALKKNENIHILIMNVQMPVMDGLTTLDVVLARFPHVKVILLAEQFEARTASECMSKGANCFLAKTSGQTKLVEAILEVHAEGTYFDKMTSKAMRVALANTRSNQLLKDKSFKEKELLVLQYVCKGNTNRKIAEFMNISASTVDFYKGKIYSKTECHNKVDLIKFALRNDLISLADL